MWRIVERARRPEVGGLAVIGWGVVGRARQARGDAGGSYRFSTLAKPMRTTPSRARTPPPARPARPRDIASWAWSQRRCSLLGRGGGSRGRGGPWPSTGGGGSTAGAVVGNPSGIGTRAAQNVTPPPARARPIPAASTRTDCRRLTSHAGGPPAAIGRQPLVHRGLGQLEVEVGPVQPQHDAAPEQQQRRRHAKAAGRGIPHRRQVEQVHVRSRVEVRRVSGHPPSGCGFRIEEELDPRRTRRDTKAATKKRSAVFCLRVYLRASVSPWFNNAYFPPRKPRSRL